MTELLQKVIAKVSELPKTRQDKVASWLLEELAFQEKAEASEGTLEDLIARARDEIARGEVYPLESIL
jgi:hypothetical protein